MNIWTILQLEQTKDKRKIKRAYAKLAKDNHPEEKPEAFKLLYDAYQEALKFADSSEELVVENEPEINTNFDRGELHREFRVAWRHCCQNRQNEADYQKWLRYMHSEHFQLIKTDPEVMKEIVEALNYEIFASDERFYKSLMRQYEFPDLPKDQYPEELKTLHKELWRKLDSFAAKQRGAYRQEEVGGPRFNRMTFRLILFVIGIIVWCMTHLGNVKRSKPVPQFQTIDRSTIDLEKLQIELETITPMKRMEIFNDSEGSEADGSDRD